jgi:hypothetical protein
MRWVSSRSLHAATRTVAGVSQGCSLRPRMKGVCQMGSHCRDGVAKKVCRRTERVRFRLTGLEKAVLEDSELHDGLASGDGGKV